MSINGTEHEYQEHDYFGGKEFNLFDFFVLINKHWQLFLLIAVVSGSAYFYVSRPDLYYSAKTSLLFCKQLEEVVLSQETHNAFIMNSYKLTPKSGFSYSKYIRDLLFSSSCLDKLPKDVRSFLEEKVSIEDQEMGVILGSRVKDAGDIGARTALLNIADLAIKHIRNSADSPYLQSYLNASLAINDLTRQLKLIDKAFVYQQQNLDIYKQHLRDKIKLYQAIKGQLLDGVKSKRISKFHNATTEYFSTLDKLSVNILEMEKNYGNLNAIISRDKWNIKQQKTNLQSKFTLQLEVLKDYIESPIIEIENVGIFKTRVPMRSVLRQRVITSLVVGLSCGIIATILFMAFKTRRGKRH